MKRLSRWLRHRSRDREHRDRDELNATISRLEYDLGMRDLTDDEMMPRLKYTQRGVLTDELRAEIIKWDRIARGLPT